jgi:hypothetical protein
MINAPEASSHLQLEWCVVLLVVGELPAGASQGVVVTILVNLGENGPATSRMIVGSGAGISL